MPRADGRIEPGQKLTSAISARAWNRAQQAADIVLGVNPGYAVAGAPVSPLRYATLRIPKSAVTNVQWPSGMTLSVGHAIGLPQVGTRLALRNTKLTAGNPAEDGSNRVTSENDLAVPEAATQWLDVADLGFAQDQFGVIQSLHTATDAESEIEYYYITAIVGGVFKCRALAMAPGDRLIGPTGVPSNNGLKPMWRPYAVMAPAGPARVLAVGAWYRLGTENYPRVWECLVSM